MKKQILVVDDEKGICEVLKDILENDGLSVDVCYRGIEAMQFLQEKQYSLVLIDIKLEGKMSGVDLIKEAVKITPKPAIIAVSATPKVHLEELFKKAGLLERVERILEKPSDLRPERFIAHIRQTLSKERE